MRYGIGLCVIMVSVLVCAPGCIIVGRGEDRSAPPAVAHKSMAQLEIDAAAGLSFDHERQSALADIAARPGLDAYDQSYLARVIFEKVSFEHHRLELLTKLIGNPSFSNAAKSTILHRLNSGLTFEHNRRQILKQLNDRGPLES